MSVSGKPPANSGRMKARKHSSEHLERFSVRRIRVGHERPLPFGPNFLPMHPPMLFKSLKAVFEFS
jgi:hypothetical protein